ncbi:MAG: hypothetical protein QN168_03170 [Armatimonadota bacterium]|nr:hypothetical protein [Armatimonadota bacterium]
MTTLYVAMEDALLAVREHGGGWMTDMLLQGAALTCVAADPGHPERLYAGTEDQGLWRSADGGRRWAPAGRGIVHPHVTAVAVGQGPSGRLGTVYAGTEPSALFRSTDGGERWEELRAAAALPSAPTWSFPPRPQTHHVRWIAVDPHDRRHVYAAIEAGALIRSEDGGDVWIDRTPDGPYDTHTLALHPVARGRLYAAAGDGYFESRDGGRTWQSPQAGLRHGYLFGVAVDPADPETVVVSAASGPGRAYAARTAATYVYVRRGDRAWTQVGDGLPEPKGTTISVFATHPDRPHTIYAANNRGVFCSGDAGMRWERLDVPWPEQFLAQAVAGLIVQA